MFGAIFLQEMLVAGRRQRLYFLRWVWAAILLVQLVPRLIASLFFEHNRPGSSAMGLFVQFFDTFTAQHFFYLLVLTPATSSGTAVRLAYLRQPSNVMAQATMAPAVEVLIQDATGATVTTASNLVTLTLKGGTGLGGTLTVAAQHGIASFSNLTLSVAGTGYTLLASSPKLTPKTSKTFTVREP